MKWSSLSWIQHTIELIYKSLALFSFLVWKWCPELSDSLWHHDWDIREAREEVWHGKSIPKQLPPLTTEEKQLLHTGTSCEDYSLRRAPWGHTYITRPPLELTDIQNKALWRTGVTRCVLGMTHCQIPSPVMRLQPLEAHSLSAQFLREMIQGCKDSCCIGDSLQGKCKLYASHETTRCTCHFKESLNGVKLTLLAPSFT